MSTNDFDPTWSRTWEWSCTWSGIENQFQEMCCRCHSDDLQKYMGIWCLNGCISKQQFWVCSSQSKVQNYCSVHWVNEQTIQRTEVRIQLCKSHWHAILKPSQTVMNDDIKINSQGCKDHRLGSAIWASQSATNRLFLDHFMVILNKNTSISWWTVHWLITV